MPHFSLIFILLAMPLLGALFLLDSTRLEGSFPKFLNGFALFQRYIVGGINVGGVKG